MQQTMVQSRNNVASTQPSSIGLAWPPRYDFHNQRVKGWAGLVETRYCLERRLAEGVSEVHMHLAPRNVSEDGATRLALRFVVPNMGIQLLRDHSRFSESLGSLASERGWSGGVEAIIDISRVLPGHSIVYFGFNAPGRIMNSEIFRAETASADAVNQMPIVPLQEAIARIQNAGLCLEVLPHASPEEISRITQLYQQAFPRYIFPIDETAVSDIVNNPDNLVLVARNQSGRIVSSLAAEHAVFHVGNRGINLIEVSEAATDTEYRGNGLLTALYQQIIDILHQGYDSGNTIVYAEARAPWVPANIVTRRGGLEFCGMLNQPCTIVSNRSPGMQYAGIFEDLTVWAHQSF